MLTFFRRRCGKMLAIMLMTAVWAHPPPSLAQPSTDHLRSEPARQNLALLASLVAAGGGPDAFQATTLLKSLPQGLTEELQLRKHFGDAQVELFAKVFTSVVLDSLAALNKQGISLPTPQADLVDRKAIAEALYTAGSVDRAFDVERLFDTLFSQKIHDSVMGNVARRYGAAGENAYHQVLAALITDLHGGKKLTIPMNATHMHDSMSIASPAATSSSPARGAPEAPLDHMHTIASPPPATQATPEADRGVHVGHDVAMQTNANGVMSTRGMAAMKMDMSTMDPATMPAVTNLADPMTREGSGTSWMPDATPVYGRMFGRGDDMQMTHGALWLRYINTGSTRGSAALKAPDWWMYMRTHPTSAGAQLGLRVMLSSDFATVGGGGYPELFQTGEQWKGQPLHDRQHPHDLVSELAIAYSGQIGPKNSAYFYVGYPGEPALGPPVFMHRPIAYDYAPSPLGHHWQDSTHITFGVVTTGFATPKFKLEGSTFTGREPNQTRTNFDPIHLDSYSGRLSWNPSRALATQVSYGFIKSPEGSDPTANIRRTTTSVMYVRPVTLNSSWSHTLVFGQNDSTAGERTNTYLYESDYRRAGNAIFIRAEQTQKSGSDLVLGALDLGRIFNIGAYTIGFAHDLAHKPSDTVTALGFDFTYNTKPTALDKYYGSGSPVSFEVFMRLRPPRFSGQKN